MMAEPLSSGSIHSMEIELREAAVFVGASGFSGSEAAMIGISEDRSPVPIALTAATLNLKVSPAGERPVLTKSNVLAAT